MGPLPNTNWTRMPGPPFPWGPHKIGKRRQNRCRLDPDGDKDVETKTRRDLVQLCVGRCTGGATLLPAGEPARATDVMEARTRAEATKDFMVFSPLLNQPTDASRQSTTTARLYIAMPARSRAKVCLVVEGSVAWILIKF